MGKLPLSASVPSSGKWGSNSSRLIRLLSARSRRLGSILALMGQGRDYELIPKPSHPRPCKPSGLRAPSPVNLKWRPTPGRPQGGSRSESPFQTHCFGTQAEAAAEEVCAAARRLVAPSSIPVPAAAGSASQRRQPRLQGTLTAAPYYTISGLYSARLGAFCIFFLISRASYCSHFITDGSDAWKGSAASPSSLSR